MEQYSDDDLIKLLKSGLQSERTKALNHLYDLHYNGIRNYVLRNSGQNSDVKDLFQDVIIVFYEKLIDHDLKITGSIKNYLYAVCRNIWLNRLRKSGKMVHTEHIENINDSYFDPQEETRTLEELSFDKLIEKLGDGCKEILTLFYYKKLSMKAIAQRLNLANEGVAKNKKARCIAKLRELYKSKN